ncbi:MAG: HAMP domain-containing sensor histidine kinase [Candidatus Omnitrophota bacterium]
MKIQYKIFLGFLIVLLLAAVLADIAVYYLIGLFVLSFIISVFISASISRHTADKIKVSRAQLQAEIQEKTAGLVLAEQESNEQTVLLDNTKELMASIMDELEATNLELQELDQMRKNFIEYIVHELRNPIIPICEGVTLVLNGSFGEINNDQRTMLESSCRSAKKLYMLVNNLLDIAKMEAGEIELSKEKVDINALVLEVIDAFHSRAVAKNIEFKSKLSSETLFGYLDRDKVMQVFNNLLSNAFKFTEQGSIVVEVKSQGDWIQCSVTDTGRGVAEDDLPKLFEKFHQVGKKINEKGTGLGLAIVESNIKLLGGQIRVSSKEGEGTQFVFTLPKYNDENEIESKAE